MHGLDHDGKFLVLGDQLLVVQDVVLAEGGEGTRLW
jgi:hypothetical protein